MQRVAHCSLDMQTHFYIAGLEILNSAVHLDNKVIKLVYSICILQVYWYVRTYPTYSKSGYIYKKVLLLDIIFFNKYLLLLCSNDEEL